MPDPGRIPRILRVLKFCWERYPEKRLGQLVSDAHVQSLKMHSKKVPLFFVDDDDLEDALRELFQADLEAE